MSFDSKNRFDFMVNSALTVKVPLPHALALALALALTLTLLDKYIRLFIHRETESAKRILRDQPSSIVGFEAQAAKINELPRNRHCVLSHSGNPTTHNILAVFAAAKHKLIVELQMQVVVR